jgi:hypothetical protein
MEPQWNDGEKGRLKYSEKKPVPMLFRPQQIPHGQDFMGDNVTLRMLRFSPVGTILPLLHIQHLILLPPSAVSFYQLTPSL